MSTAALPKRNDPCPCGSGKRFKHCHGSLASDSRLESALGQRARGDLTGALASLDRTLEETPGQPHALNIRGLVRQDLMDLEGAEDDFRAAIARNRDFAEAHFNLGILMLVMGRYAEGWREYGWRTRAPGYADYANYPFGMPRWNGEPLAGKRILVHGEQGFGDTIQCARFLGPLAREAAAVDVFCQPALVSLMQRMPGVGQAQGNLADRPTHDFHAPIIDIAAHYLATVDAPHWFGPYVRPLEQRLSRWAPELARKGRPLVGFVWKGSALQSNDRLRSLTPESAIALSAGAKNATFVNLQFGEAPPPGAAWIDAGSRLRDWDDTVAVLAHLDLVIAVDTAVAHVAGAMAKPVWVVRPFYPDWRWGASGEDTRWYPSMKVLRQHAPGDWSGVLADVAARLAAQNSSSATSGR